MTLTERPVDRIRVFDLETTGMDPEADAPCEIGWCDVEFYDGEWRVVGPSDGFLLNPGRPIPPEACAVHHITDGDVAEAAPWALLRDDGPNFFGDAGFQVCAAHNAKFERQWLTDEVTGGLPWICTYKCALRVYPNEPSHSNQVLRYSRKPKGLDPERAMPSHRAGPDAYVTAFLLRDLLNYGGAIPDLIKWSSEPALLQTCQFGKHRGKPWSEVDTSYLEWIQGQDFDEDVMFTATTELAKRRSPTS